MASLSQLRFDELKAAGQLPTPSGVALAILRLLQKEGATVQEIARVLRTDPALTGRLLKMANSARMGAARPVVTVQDAMVRLGNRLVRQLALGFSVLTGSRSGLCQGFDYSGFWSRSLATAVAAQAVSRMIKSVAPEEAFTCGLLCRIGALGLASIFPEEYAEMLAACGGGSSEQMIVHERARFATDHMELGAALLEDWGLPDASIEAVRNHGRNDGREYAENSRFRSISVVLELSERLSAICVATDAQREQLVGQLLECAERAQIPNSELIPLCDRVVSEWREWGKTLEVATQEVPPFAELAERSPQPEPVEVKQTPAVDVEQLPLLDILVVDDKDGGLQAVTTHLRNDGHQVRNCNNADEGLKVILENKPHLVLVDWSPGSSGADICNSLRGTEAGRDVSILVLLDGQNESQFMEAFAAGANDFVSKPVHPQILVGRVRACQRLAQLQRELSREKEELRHCLAELAIANRQLQQTALTDALTSLPNRRYMMDRLNQEWAGSCRYDRQLACMLLDLDHFKQVNDRYGHDIGDIVLQRTAAVLRSTTRRSDVVCRLDGEEFVVICPDTDLEAAARGGERLRMAVESSVIDVPGFCKNVTVSVGVAVRSAGIPDPEALVKAADNALYDAKRSGRNRVCAAPQVPSKDSPTIVSCAV